MSSENYDVVARGVAVAVNDGFLGIVGDGIVTYLLGLFFQDGGGGFFDFVVGGGQRVFVVLDFDGDIQFHGCLISGKSLP